MVPSEARAPRLPARHHRLGRHLVATLLVVAIARLPPPHRAVRRVPALARSAAPMSIPFNPADRAEEDDRMDREDRRIARLAAAELGRYADVDPHEAWLIFHRIRALRKRGIAPVVIRQRLDPDPR